MNVNNSIAFSMNFIVTVLLIFFFPGYSIIGLTGLHKILSKEEEIVVAIISSTAIAGIIGTIAWNLGGVQTYGVPGILVINSIILVVEILKVVKKKLAFRSYEIDNSENSLTKSKLIEVGIVSSAAVFILISYFTIHYAYAETLPVLGDEFIHIGFIKKILDGYFSWQEIQLGIVSSPAYPYLWHVAMALSVSTSNLTITGCMFGQKTK